MKGPLVIVDYDPRWPDLYEEEKGQILDVIGHVAVAIKHVGSTAVPGLGAKPIIDIMVAIPDLADAQKCTYPMLCIGYEFVPEYEDFIPERRYFHKGPPGDRTHHLSMVEPTSEFWEQHLLFRDYLRAHPEVAAEYERLKWDLAAWFGWDRLGYTDAKTSFIEEVIAAARASEA